MWPAHPARHSFSPNARVVGRPEGSRPLPAPGAPGISRASPPSFTGQRDVLHEEVGRAQRARRAQSLSTRTSSKASPQPLLPRAPSTPARPRPPSLISPAGGPLTRMPCSTRTRSSSSIPKDTLRPSLLSVLPMAGGRRAGGQRARLQSN